MRPRGYLSIVFSLSILCICALLFAMAETARMAGARCYLQMAVNSSVDSMFSQYHRELWEEYRLLFVEYEEEQEVIDDFQRFMTPYLEAESWYPMADQKTELLQMLSAVDSGGDYLEREILDYMKFGVWNLVFPADQAEELSRTGKEAEAVQEIATSYRGDTKSAWRLEQALEEIQGCLTEQQLRLSEGDICLEQDQGTAFIRAARALSRQLERIPSLVSTYEARADQLMEQLTESRRLLNSQSDTLSDPMRQGLADELQEYESYVARDGERRLEITSLSSWSAVQAEIVAAAIREAEVVMEILADWDDEDEDPDEEALWNRVSRIWQRYEKRLLTVSFGIQDKERQGWLEQAEELFRLDLLAIVLPEGTNVSKTVVSMEHLPSQTAFASSGQSPSVQAMGERLLVMEYCGAFLSDFSDDEGDGGEQPMQYELEYLYTGDAWEEENLNQTAKQLLLLREGLNLAYIFSDNQKRTEARELATLLVGGTGIAPLILVTAFFIMSVWALGESILDLRILLAGGNVPLIKQSGDWQLSLEQLLMTGQSGALAPPSDGEGDKKGMSYEAYLKVILFFTEREILYYRMMDVIQLNLSRKQDSFRMAHARYRIDIRAEVTNRHLFLSPFFLQPYQGGTRHTYRSQAETQKAY